VKKRKEKCKKEEKRRKDKREVRRGKKINDTEKVKVVNIENSTQLLACTCVQDTFISIYR
jgi:hypothetical protein